MMESQENGIKILFRTKKPIEEESKPDEKAEQEESKKGKGIQNDKRGKLIKQSNE